MAIESECIVCRMRQALDVCNFVGADEETSQSVLKRVMEILLSSMDQDPPEGLSYLIQNELKTLTNHDDPYKNVKDESIQKALALYPYLENLVDNSDQPLRTAVELCIAGNVIDFAPSNSHDIEHDIQKVMETEKTFFDFDDFRQTLENAQTVLVIGDNAGETVFDRLFMEQIDKQFYYAVKQEPMINDALYEDALASGIGPVAEIIKNGSPVGGTFIPRCSEEFKKIYYSADMVISKGQANFETLVDEQRRIFFLFKVKCALLSRKHSLPLNDYVLLDNRKLHKSPA